MSYVFTQEEQELIKQAIDASTGLEINNSPTVEGKYKVTDIAEGRNAVPFYQALSDILTAKLDAPEGLDSVAVQNINNALQI